MNVDPRAQGRRLGLLLAAALLAGCSEKSNNPVGAEEELVLDADAVSQQSVSTLSFVNEFMGSVDELAQGDFSTVTGGVGVPQGALRDSAQVVWNDQTQRWELDVQGTETDASGTATYDVSAWFQFRDPQGTPQQDPDSTTASLEMEVDYFVDLHFEDEESTFDVVLDYLVGVTVGGLPDGPYLLDGTGVMSVDMALSGPDGNANATLDMGWAADLTLPADGCPSGTAQVTMEEFRFDATYDGTNTYVWELREDGHVVATGNEQIPCTVPAS